MQQLFVLHAMLAPEGRASCCFDHFLFMPQDGFFLCPSLSSPPCAFSGLPFLTTDLAAGMYVLIRFESCLLS